MEYNVNNGGDGNLILINIFKILFLKAAMKQIAKQ